MDSLSYAVVLKVAGSLLLLLGLILLLFFFLRRYGPKAGLALPGSQFKIEGQLSLGPKKSLVLVRFLNKLLLIGVTESHINLLQEVEADHDSSQQSAFSSHLESRMADDSAGSHAPPSS